MITIPQYKKYNLNNLNNRKATQKIFIKITKKIAEISNLNRDTTLC
jgi:hypothetical protein